MKNFLKYDGKFYQFMNTFGNLVILNLLFVLTSLPLITLVSSLSALYYATIKTVRSGTGYPVQEYIAAFKRELKTGIVWGVLLLITAIILYIDISYVSQSPTVFGAISFAVFCLLAFIWVSFFIYGPIVLSRFSLKRFDLFKLTIVMLFRHLPYTVLLVIGYLIVGLLIYLMPIPLLFVLPSLLIYAVSFVIEKLFKRYVKEEPEAEEKWYTNL